jgi:hypothetical protein
MKLLMASCFHLLDSRPGIKDHKTVGATKAVDQQVLATRGVGLPVHRQLQLFHSWWPNGKAVKAGGRAMLVFSVPALCYFLVNK